MKREVKVKLVALWNVPSYKVVNNSNESKSILVVGVTQQAYILMFWNILIIWRFVHSIWAEQTE